MIIRIYLRYNESKLCDIFQEAVVQPGDSELEQQGAEGLGSVAGRADHQQEPVGSRRHVGHRTGGHDRRPAAVAVG